MQPKVGHVPRRWKVWAEAAAAKLTARAADVKLKATMIGFLTRAMNLFRVKHLDEETVKRIQLSSSL
jgi:hypothetical protein